MAVHPLYEAQGAYDTARPRLTIVERPSFSQLPHDIMRDTSLSRDARLLYAVLQGRWWQDGVCSTSHALLAAEMGCTTRRLRAYLDELIDADLIVERAEGQRRAKVYAPAPIGRNVPIEETSNTSEISDCFPPNTSFPSDSGRGNRKKTTRQSEKNDTGNTSEISDSYKKTRKKTEERPEGKTSSRRRSATAAPKDPGLQAKIIDLIEAGGAPRPVMGGQNGKAIKEAGVDPDVIAAAYLAAWRGEWDPDGGGWLRRNLSIYWVVQKVDGYRTWAAEHAPEPPHVNGTAAKCQPPTDEDLTLWDRALDDLRPTMSAGNFENYLAPLGVAGRGEGGELWLVVNPLLADQLAGFKPRIVRALSDAGDPRAGDVRFKARRAPSQG